MMTVRELTPKSERLIRWEDRLIKEHPEILEAINHFEDCVERNTYKGGGHPHDVPLIERDYCQAKARLIETIVNANIEAIFSDDGSSNDEILDEYRKRIEQLELDVTNLYQTKQGGDL